MGKDEAASNHQYLFFKKDSLRSKGSSLSKKESKKVSPCQSRLQTPSQPVLGPGHEKKKALKLPWTWLEQQDLDHAALKQAGELRQRLADEIAGIVRPSATTKAGKKWSGSDSGCKGNGATYHKLEELLKTLQGEADKEHAGLLQRLREEVALEKSYFLCHLLEVHGHPSLAVEKKKDKVAKGTAKWRSKNFRGKDIPESFKDRKQFFTRYYPDSQKHPPMKKIKQEPESSSEKEDSAKSRLTSSLVEEKTSEGDLYQTLPDAGWELQSSGPSLEKFSPSRCSEESMEDRVSSGILPAFFSKG